MKHLLPHCIRYLKEALSLSNGERMATNGGVCTLLGNRIGSQTIFDWTQSHCKDWVASKGISLTNKGYLDTPGIMTEKRREFCKYLLEKIGEEL